MPRINLDFGLPDLRAGLMSAGTAVGSLPGQYKAMKQREAELEIFNQMAQASEQGTAAAIEGNVEKLQTNIDRLIQMRDAATDLKSKNNAQRAITNLQNKLKGAKQAAVGNKAKELVTIEQQLQNLPEGDTPKRLALQKRLEVLQQDPDVVQQYQEYQLNTWRFEQAEENIKAEEWLDSNRGIMLEAIEAGDMEQLNNIIENAGVFTEAAQVFANSAIQNAENMVKFEENSIERKIGPSVDFYTEQVNNLPNEISKNLKTTLAAYTKVSKEGWDGKQWNTGARIRAKQLEQELRSQIRSINSQIATSEYFAARREEANKKEQIKKLEIQLNTPMGSKYLVNGRIMAQSLLGEDEELTEATIQKYAKQLYELDRNRIIQQLADLRGEEPVDDPASVTIHRFSEKDQKTIEEAMKENPAYSKEEVIKILLEKKLISPISEEGTEDPEEDDNASFFEDLINSWFSEEGTEKLSARDKRMQELPRGLVARHKKLGPREERMEQLGPREERMAALRKKL